MRRLIATLLVVTGIGVVGAVVADDTGDDVGDISVDATDATASDLLTRSSDAPVPPGRDSDTDGGGGSPPSPPSVTTDAVGDREQVQAAAPRPAAPPIGRSSGRIEDVDLAPPPAPVELAVPSIGVVAAVVAVGVDPGGLMTVPEDVSTVGWYRFGAAPRSDGGTTVLAGHVDSRVQGRGAFFDLRAVDVGDEVTVRDDDGAATTWRITGRRTYDKASLPIDELYRREGPRRLVLITCGGGFDAEARSYRSNVVVEAEPVP